MKRWMIILALAFLPAPSLCADTPLSDSQGRDLPADYRPADPRTEKGVGIQRYAEDGQSGAQKNFGVQPVHDNEVFAVFRADRLEYQTGEEEGLLLWDLQAWVGRDYNKLYLKSEGTWLTDAEKVDEAGVELLYSRNIGSFWDLQAGIRHDFEPDPERSFATFGIQGLAPLWFEVEASAYISEDGDVSAALEAEYDLLLTQRLILQPRLETGIALQEVEEYGVGQGINDIELGLRLRYEIRRELAPYIGLSWSRKLGETADLAETDGEDIDATSLVVGAKVWF